MPNEERRSRTPSLVDVPVSERGSDKARPAEPRSPTPPSVSMMPGPQRMPSFFDTNFAEADTSVTHQSGTTVTLPPLVSQRDRALLTVLSGVHAGKVFSLDSAESVLGRGRDAGVRIDDVGISRAHCRIVRSSAGPYVVEDLGSKNGTTLGGNAIDRAELRSGDRLQLGPNVVLRFALIDEAEERLAHQLYEASTKDALTQTFNRKYFLERLNAEVAYALRHRSYLAVVLFDLDHFKTVNDTYGHLAGDVVLRVVAAQVNRTIRAEDVLARYGGEEFVLLVRGIEHRNVAHFGERVRRAVEKLAVPWEDQTLKATISCGVASLSECLPGASPEEASGPSSDPPSPIADSTPPVSIDLAAFKADRADAALADADRDADVLAGLQEQLLRLADDRLYAAKSAGRNRVVSTS